MVEFDSLIRLNTYIKTSDYLKYKDEFLRCIPLYKINAGYNILNSYLSNIYVESNYLKSCEEDLYYSASGLLKTFPKYFNKELANKYAKKPVKIANRVYANRMGNGNEESGDGWLYRGKSLIQITGKENHEIISEGLKVDFISQPELLLLPKFAVEASCWWFKNKIK